jgi:hypothetical protein
LVPAVEFICLANSYKEKRRCVAGLRKDGSGWVRPVSQRVHGELEYHQYRYPDKSEPRVLDVLRAGLAEPRPLPHQPENWLIDDTPWQPVERRPSGKYAPILASAVSRDSLLLDSAGGRVAAESLAGHPVAASLALIQPADVHWHNLPPLADGKKRPRAAFRLGNARYHLPLTDPAYAKTLAMLETGEHLARELWIPENPKLLFTISLSEPFEGVCYKLVAAVVVLPAAWDALF